MTAVKEDARIEHDAQTEPLVLAARFCSRSDAPSATHLSGIAPKISVRLLTFCQRWPIIAIGDAPYFIG